MEKSTFLRSTLVKSADKITKVSESAVKEYVDNIDLLAAILNETMLKRTDILDLIGGEENISIMKNNHDKHLRFVAALLQTPDSETLVDTLLWVFPTHMRRGFSSNYWIVYINILIQILKENVSEKAFFEIVSIYNWININIPNFVMAAAEEIQKSKYND